MDRVTALVAIAHLKLRLELIERNPQLLEGLNMVDIRRPIELAGFRSRLARATRQEADLTVTGKRYDTVLDAIDEQHATLKRHVGSLEVEHSQLDQVINRMVAAAGDNGAPKNDGEESSIASSEVGEVGQIITSRTE
jgi:hypothetical protein